MATAVIGTPPASSIVWTSGVEGVSCTLKWIVTGDNGTYSFHAPWYSAIENANIPGRVASFDSRMVCVEVTATQFLNSLDKWEIVARYVDRLHYTVRVNGSTFATQTSIDNSGELMVVNKLNSIPCIAEVMAQRPQGVIDIEWWESNGGTPGDYMDIVGHVNQNEWNGFPPYTLLITGVRDVWGVSNTNEGVADWTSNQYTKMGLTLEWQGYKFAGGSGRVDHRPISLWRDPVTKREDPKLVEEASNISGGSLDVGNGWRRLYPYPIMDFDLLTSDYFENFPW